MVGHGKCDDRAHFREHLLEIPFFLLMPFQIMHLTMHALLNPCLIGWKMGWRFGVREAAGVKAKFQGLMTDGSLQGGDH
jgi:hypothetical protein